MNRLALGTVQFGMPYGIANSAGQVSREMARAILSLGSRNGVNMVDTAIQYGESESCLGEVGISSYSVVTKLPDIPKGENDVRGWVLSELRASLARLRIHSVYGLMLHRPHSLMGTLEIIQAPLNIIDQRLVKSGCLSRLKDSGVEVHTRSAFLQGLLLMPRAKVPQRFAAWDALWERWESWLETNRFSALEACLAFALSHQEIDRVVVGVDSDTHLEEILRALKKSGQIDCPDFSCDDERLVNPSLWCKL
jgi:aryl-alcohol dehydrogenase-like predicted oxidoreductase